MWLVVLTWDSCSWDSFRDISSQQQHPFPYSQPLSHLWLAHCLDSMKAKIMNKRKNVKNYFSHLPPPSQRWMKIDFRKKKTTKKPNNKKTQQINQNKTLEIGLIYQLTSWRLNTNYIFLCVSMPSWKPHQVLAYQPQSLSFPSGIWSQKSCNSLCLRSWQHSACKSSRLALIQTSTLLAREFFATLPDQTIQENPWCWWTACALGTGKTLLHPQLFLLLIRVVRVTFLKHQDEDYRVRTCLKNMHIGVWPKWSSAEVLSER